MNARRWRRSRVQSIAGVGRDQVAAFPRSLHSSAPVRYVKKKRQLKNKTNTVRHVKRHSQSHRAVLRSGGRVAHRAPSLSSGHYLPDLVDKLASHLGISFDKHSSC